MIHIIDKKVINTLSNTTLFLIFNTGDKKNDTEKL